MCCSKIPHTRSIFIWWARATTFIHIIPRLVNVIINSVKRSAPCDPVSTVHERDHSCLQVSTKFADTSKDGRIV